VRLKVGERTVDALPMSEVVGVDARPPSMVRVERPLTRMVDGALFSGHLQRALRRNAGVPGGLALLAVAPDPLISASTDGTRGMQEEISLITAGRLVGFLHYSSFVTRKTSDVFLVLAEGIGGVDQAVLLAEHLMAAVREPEMVWNQEAVTASVGIAFQEPGVTPELLAESATVAVFSARSDGGDCYRIYGEGIRETTETSAGTRFHRSGPPPAVVATTP